MSADKEELGQVREHAEFHPELPLGLVPLGACKDEAGCDQTVLSLKTKPRMIDRRACTGRGWVSDGG
jgi:hypothetical protein